MGNFDFLRFLEKVKMGKSQELRDLPNIRAPQIRKNLWFLEILVNDGF